MQASRKAVQLIKEFEGLKLNAYLDAVGIPTIGWGHTQKVDLGMKITQDEAEEYLWQDIEVAIYELERMIKVDLLQHEMDALISLVFNVGGPKIAKSTLIKRINAKDPKASDEFIRWDKAKNPRTGAMESLPGLTRRRKAEKRLYDSGSY